MNAGLGNAGVRSSKNAAGGGLAAITANNGLTANTISNTQLGGTFIQDTQILQFGFSMTWIANNASGNFLVVNAGANATGLTARATNATGVALGWDQNSGSTSSFAAEGQGSGIVLRLTNRAPTQNDVASILSITRTSTGGAGQNGIGGSIDFTIETSTAANFLSNQIISKLTDATAATRTSQLIITGVSNAVTADLFTLSGSGATRLNKYGIGTFAGVPAFTLQVDASGNLIEGAAAGGGWGTTGTVATLTGNAELLQAGFYFAIKNGTNYLFTVDPAGAATLKAGDTSYADTEAEIVMSAPTGADGSINFYTQNNTGLKAVQVNIQSSSQDFEVSCANGLKVTGNAAALIHTGTSLTDGAGAAIGTLATSPIAGNPTKWLPIDDNGTTRHVPAW